MKFWDFIFRNRYTLAIWLIIVSVLLSMIFGAIFSLNADFWYSTQMAFLWFFASGIVSALLLIITKIPEELTFGFGVALYYGALVITELLSKITHGDTSYFAGFIIAALVCYVVYKICFD